jgi:hypothetical protein
VVKNKTPNYSQTERGTSWSLAKLGYAVWTLVVPLRTRIEISCDAAGGRFRALLGLLRDQAWLVTLPALAILLAVYPPDRTRYPAYGVLVPVLLLCAFYLAEPAQALFARFFERRSYLGESPSLVWCRFALGILS